MTNRIWLCNNEDEILPRYHNKTAKILFFIIIIKHSKWVLHKYWKKNIALIRILKYFRTIRFTYLCILEKSILIILSKLKKYKRKKFRGQRRSFCFHRSNTTHLHQNETSINYVTRTFSILCLFLKLKRIAKVRICNFFSQSQSIANANQQNDIDESKLDAHRSIDHFLYRRRILLTIKTR